MHTVRANADDRYKMVYDAAINEPFRKTMEKKDVSLWPLYDALRCPTLVMRGAESDLLL